MAQNTNRPSFYQRLQIGLREAIEFAKGDQTLRTTEVAAPPPSFGPADIVGLRKRLNASQSLFASLLNVSTKAVQGWEQGLRQPSHATLRLLQILQARPEVLDAVFMGSSAPARPKKSDSARRKKSQNRAGRNLSTVKR